MKTKQKTNNLIENKNFLNNQNYIFGNRELSLVSYNYNTLNNNSFFASLFRIITIVLFLFIIILFALGFGTGSMIFYIFLIFPIFFINFSVYFGFIYPSIKPDNILIYKKSYDYEFILEPGELSLIGYILFEKKLNEYESFEKLDF